MDEFDGEMWGDSDHVEGCDEDGPVETAKRHTYEGGRLVAGLIRTRSQTSMMFQSLEKQILVIMGNGLRTKVS